MKIIIEVEDNYYNSLKHNKDDNSLNYAETVIKSGTPYEKEND